MKLSVIIPDTNSPQVGEIITRLRSETMTPESYEILVVGSDRLGQVVCDENTHLIEMDADACASDKRNRGMQLAQGEVFLFLDDDCLPAPGLMECHLEQHAGGEEVVGGAVTFDRQSFLQLADNVSAFHDLLPHTSRGPRAYLCTANLSVKRTAAERTGPMLPRRNRAEDLEWTTRMRALGYTLYFEPRAIVVHNPDRGTIQKVWQHWTGDSYDTLEVRLRYAQRLGTPKLARYRCLYLWASPLIAAWATARTFQDPTTLRLYGTTLPLVFFTKLAWCWSAFIHFPSSQAPR